MTVSGLENIYSTNECARSLAKLVWGKVKVHMLTLARTDTAQETKHRTDTTCYQQQQHQQQQQ